MTSRLSQIAIRIRSELHELEDVLLRIKKDGAGHNGVEMVTIWTEWR